MDITKTQVLIAVIIFGLIGTTYLFLFGTTPKNVKGNAVLIFQLTVFKNDSAFISDIEISDDGKEKLNENKFGTYSFELLDAGKISILKRPLLFGFFSHFDTIDNKSFDIETNETLAIFRIDCTKSAKYFKLYNAEKLILDQELPLCGT